MHLIYSTILSRLRSSDEKILDLGTCLGQDPRKLLFDGAPPESLYGSNIFSTYEGLGHALVKDAATFQNRFIVGGLFDTSPESALVKLAGTWDMINIVMFLTYSVGPIK